MSWLDEVSERSSRATPGPWKPKETGMVKGMRTIDRVIYSHNRTPYVMENDAEFIAHARTDVPELVGRLKRATEAMRKSIARSDDYGDSHCSQPIREVLDELEAAPKEGE